jgi:hypothetical protein
MQGQFQTDSAQTAYQLVSKNTPEAFHKQPGYKQWIRRLNKPVDLARRLARAAALKAVATNLRRLYVVDSFPIPLSGPFGTSERGFSVRIEPIWADRPKVGFSDSRFMFSFIGPPA